MTSRLQLILLATLLSVACATTHGIRNKSLVCTPSSLTTAGYWYTHFFSLPGSGTGNPGAVVEFNVTAPSDAVVYLYSSTGTLSYVITIDDSSESGLSSIRRANNPTPVALSAKKGHLAGGQATIWIRQEENLLYVGLQNEVNPFIDFEDSNPLKVSYVEFGFKGVSGGAHFDYCYTVPSICYPIHLLPGSKSTRFNVHTFIGQEVQVDFSIMSKSDARIILSPTAYPVPNRTQVYEIWLDAASDELTSIRRTFMGEAAYEKEVPNLLSAEEYRSFFVRLFDGTVVIGKQEDEYLPFFEWTDPNPLSVYFVGYSSGPGTSANWIC